jgi:hypothetical protein
MFLGITGYLINNGLVCILGAIGIAFCNRELEFDILRGSWPITFGLFVFVSLTTNLDQDLI